MQKFSLQAMARELLDRARDASGGRAASTVRLSAGQDSWDGRSGDLLVVPYAAHTLEALEDSAVLLTVAKLT